MKIKPIKELRDTNKISDECHSIDEPIFITKNGYQDLVIMSQDVYDKNTSKITYKVDRKPLEINDEQSQNMGFVKVSCVTPEIKVSDVKYNVQLIKNILEEENKKQTNLVVFPELSLTGYTCSDLFFQQKLLKETVNGLKELENYSKNLDLIFLVGAPLAKENKLYNCAIAICHGEILAVIAKQYIPNYNEFYEKRHFDKVPDINTTIEIGGRTYPFGNKFILVNRKCSSLKIGVEICEDLWVANTPSTGLASNGATVICNLSASNELVGKASYRRNLVSMTSARLVCAYLYCSSGLGESSTDMVFSGHNIISENGKIISESELFSNDTITTEIDLDVIEQERHKLNVFENKEDTRYEYIYFDLNVNKPELTRFYPPNPFIPGGNKVDLNRVNQILKIQAMGLYQRMHAIHCKKAVIGLSGGLDSTLALIVIIEAYKKLGLSNDNIIAITLPAFGTTSRTLDNVKKLCSNLNIPLREINISKSVNQHLEDIGHLEGNFNNAYENAQARERTQVLMDVANDVGGIVIGTGDLSELALGWCTYNGDQMSMYGVNCSIPKTLVKYLVQGYALQHDEIKEELFDILDTPISPELIPANDDKISQKTEDIIGPYELHDFFLYHFIRYNLEPKKIFELACYAYKDKYDKETIHKWLTLFIKRFFSNQFKRSAMPDGVKVGTVSVSPRGDLRMPSDASNYTFLFDL